MAFSGPLVVPRRYRPTFRPTSCVNPQSGFMFFRMLFSHTVNLLGVNQGRPPTSLGPETSSGFSHFSAAREARRRPHGEGQGQEGGPGLRGGSSREWLRRRRIFRRVRSRVFPAFSRLARSAPQRSFIVVSMPAMRNPRPSLPSHFPHAGAGSGSVDTPARNPCRRRPTTMPRARSRWTTTWRGSWPDS